MTGLASVVQQLAASAPLEVERAKKALATAAERYQALPAVATLSFPPADRFLAPAAGIIAQADADLASGRPLAAYDRALTAAPTLDNLNATVAAVDGAYTAYQQHAAVVEDFSNRGFDAAAARDMLDKALAGLRQAAGLLAGSRRRRRRPSSSVGPRCTPRTRRASPRLSSRARSLPR
jgi:hypothetical protein